MWAIGHHPSSPNCKAVPPMFSGVARCSRLAPVKVPRKWAAVTSLGKGLARPATSGTSKWWTRPTPWAKQVLWASYARHPAAMTCRVLAAVATTGAHTSFTEDLGGTQTANSSTAQTSPIYKFMVNNTPYYAKHYNICNAGGPVYASALRITVLSTHMSIYRRKTYTRSWSSLFLVYINVVVYVLSFFLVHGAFFFVKYFSIASLGRN
jgi:hypothetical protein